MIDFKLILWFGETVFKMLKNGGAILNGVFLIYGFRYCRSTIQIPVRKTNMKLIRTENTSNP